MLVFGVVSCQDLLSDYSIAPSSWDLCHLIGTGVIQSMQICGDFDWFPIHSALVGLEIEWPLLRLRFSFPTVRIGSDEKLVQVYSRANRRRAGKTFPKVRSVEIGWVTDVFSVGVVCFSYLYLERVVKFNKQIYWLLLKLGDLLEPTVLKHVFFLHSFTCGKNPWGKGVCECFFCHLSN